VTTTTANGGERVRRDRSKKLACQFDVSSKIVNTTAVNHGLVVAMKGRYAAAAANELIRYQSPDDVTNHVIVIRTHDDDIKTLNPSPVARRWSPVGLSACSFDLRSLETSDQLSSLSVAAEFWRADIDKQASPPDEFLRRRAAGRCVVINQ